MTRTDDHPTLDDPGAPVALSIGELARRCGVPVRTIRFWSDEGLVPPAGRSRSGHRRYGAAAVARLDLVRTLRELGMGLDDVRAVLARRREVHEVAREHVQALDTRIRGLRVQRAVCSLLARRSSAADGGQAMVLMNDLARLSAQQRQQMIDEFVVETFAGIDPDDPGGWIATCMRTMPAELPDEPTTEQVAAWVELAELVGDPAFRARCREMTTAGTRTEVEPEGYDPALVQEHASTAFRAGIAPDSAQAAAVLARIPGLAGLDAAGRHSLADRAETLADRRVERYWVLLGVLNGWAPRPALVPVFEWFAAALRAPARSDRPG